MAALDIIVWVASGLLAAVYLMVGMMKILKPDVMQKKGQTLAEVPVKGLRAIGVAEVFGAIGVILPPAIGVLPWIAAVAAAGLALIQVLAIPRHVRNGEREMLPMNSILFALAVFVFLMRTGAVP